MAITKKWATDGPFKLLSTPRAALKGKPETKASKNASEMALVHNILLRGLNSIYLQAPNVKEPVDIMDFMTFSDCWSRVLHAHHLTEETVYFPLLEEQTRQKGAMQNNHSEHEAFLPGLVAFDKFVSAASDDFTLYDSAQFIKLIDDMGPPLEKHLHHEVKVLVDLEKDEAIDWDLMGKTMAQQSKKTADRVGSTTYPLLNSIAYVREVPFMITNSDVSYESGIHGERFPPFPWFVGQIFRWYYVPQLYGAWRFSCCDDYGLPRDLLFV
ncbi:hypothetical protein LAWI1_G008008 [Lachnellula willkommii]|uniref:Hemerythrin-like domain-containing protein n=1 Tax=Lachnellula willkommii TaxID=215461 RepID=A0A559M7T4_9HELO|nr:hypothetical protein LAWI1_G008008 [Lachnellula willkommii]